MSYLVTFLTIYLSMKNQEWVTDDWVDWLKFHLFLELKTQELIKTEFRVSICQTCFWVRAQVKCQ